MQPLGVRVEAPGRAALALDVELHGTVGGQGCDGEGVALQRDDAVAGEEDVLAGRPGDGRVGDGDARRVVRERRESCFGGPEGGHLAVSALLGMEDGEVDVEGAEGADETVDADEGDGQVDVDADGERPGVDVFVDEGEEGGHGAEVLDDEELILPAADGRHGAEDDPEKEAPGDQAVLGDGVGLDLAADVVVGSPVGEPVAHVDGRGKEKASRDPAMQPVQPLVARAGEPSDDVVLPRQEEDQRELDDGNAACPIGNVLERPLIAKIEFVKAKHQESHYISGYNGSPPHGWQANVATLEVERSESSVVGFPDDGRCGGINAQ